MNCVEFESVLPDYLEGGHTPEQQAHLTSCSACSNLLADLNSIVTEAPALQAIEDPSPRVWNALEIQLRREGIIREPAIARPSRSGFFPRWRAACLVPVAAALVIAAGIKLNHPSGAGDTAPVAKQTPAAAPGIVAQAPRHKVSSEDEQVLNSVASRPPAQLASYQNDMESANAFIRDAEIQVKSDPSDIYAQQLLMNAYAQKQMLYELAVDRTGGEQ
jgi:hypothetical protein